MARCARLAWLALLAWPLLAAQRHETLIFSRFDIDPGEWRYFEFPSKEKDARLQVHFEIQSPRRSSGVRVAVLGERDFRQLRENRPHREISSTGYRKDGDLRTRLLEPGSYAVVIDNRMEGRRKYRVEMEVNLITGPDPETLPVEYASPRKRLIVVTTSIAGFLLILALSGKALWRAARRRREIRILI